MGQAKEQFGGLPMPQRYAFKIISLKIFIWWRGTKFRFLIMSKNKMPPELLAHFKKKKEEKEGKGEEKMTDKEKRKDALKKARSRMEKKDKKED